MPAQGYPNLSTPRAPLWALDQEALPHARKAGHERPGKRNSFWKPHVFYHKLNSRLAVQCKDSSQKKSAHCWHVHAVARHRNSLPGWHAFHAEPGASSAHCVCLRHRHALRLEELVRLQEAAQRLSSGEAIGVGKKGAFEYNLPELQVKVGRCPSTVFVLLRQVRTSWVRSATSHGPFLWARSS